MYDIVQYLYIHYCPRINPNSRTNHTQTAKESLKWHRLNQNESLLEFIINYYIFSKYV